VTLRLALVLARLLSLWAILVALLLGMVLVGLAGVNPVSAYADLFRGVIVDVFGFATMLVKTTPLLFAGLGVAVALRAGLFNIGGEGQIYLGGLAAALVGLFVHGLPALLAVPLALLAAFVGGGLWALFPIFLKIKRGVNEIITTLLMNYVAIWLISYVVGNVLMEPGAPSPYTRPLDGSAQLPVIIGGTDAHAGIFVAVALALLLHFVFARTSYGFRYRMVGANPSAAAYAGVNVNQTLVSAMLVSGGLAGLGGASEVMGLQHRLFEGFSPGYGYDAVVVAFLSNGHPLGVMAMALFFGALRSGANIMQRSAGIPVAIIFAIQGLAVLFLAASLAVRRRVVRAIEGRLQARSGRAQAHRAEAVELDQH
jgi:general nucleoside transport system permease protein